jgi:hypothetical protein
MSCRCFFLRRKFLSYLDGEVPPREQERLERHLAGCRTCADLLTRLRSGHEAGRRFGRLGRAAFQPPEFEEIWEGIAVAPGRSLLQTLSTPLAVRILIALVLAQSVLLVVSLWKIPWSAAGRQVVSARPGAIRGFTPLRIGEFTSNSSPHVFTEGFVQNVYFDQDEKSLHIKLVETPHQLEPFVICEIRDLAGMTIPRQGSRVRVFGTARYDAQPGRGWHEVNPVLTLAVLKR